jgi:hypothetical protein
MVDLVPAPQRPAFEAAASQARAVSMAMLATQVGIVERVLRPLGVRHAFLKGAALSARHYGDPIVRSVSDIDVLVEARRIPEVVARLVEQGWRMSSPFWKGQPLPLFARFTSVIELDAPDGRRVEVHRLVDGSGLVFDPAALLSRATTCRMGGREISVLAPDDEFLTTVYHHARHGWSCYHWVADLVSMVDAGVTAVDAARRDRLLGPTVDAAVALARDVDRLVLDGAVAGADAGAASPFLAACLASIDRTTLPTQPTGLSDPTEMEPDFPQAWQRTWWYRVRFTLGRFRPSLTDLDRVPLPPQMVWAYWIVRPLRVLQSRLVGRR